MILGALIAAFGFFLGIIDWRRGLLACLVVGFAQDPLRKLAAGQPVAFVILVGVVFSGCTLGFIADRGLAGLQGFFALNPGLRAPVTAFVGVVVVQSIATAVVVGNPILAGIGLLSYLSPLVALLLGYEYCRSTREIGRWQRIYLVGALGVAASVLASFSGVASRLFVSIGAEVVYTTDGAVRMICGLMRSSEIAAWHVATATCLVVLWAVDQKRGLRASIVGGATLLLLLVAVVVTGRRKMLGEISLYLLFFTFLVVRWRRGASRILGVGFALGVLVSLLLVFGGEPGQDSRLDPYFQRGYSVIEEAPERLWQMTGKALVNVVERNGWLGSGAGTGAQGSQYFGGGSQLVGGSAEGGLGRIAAELGVPGLAISLWLAAAIAARLWRVARTLPRVAPRHAVRYFGYFAFLPASAAVFLAAQQVFGDPFVLIVLGLVVSSALAYPRLVIIEGRMHSEARAPHVARTAVEGRPLSPFVSP